MSSLFLSRTSPSCPTAQMAQLIRSAKSGSDWIANELDAYNITVVSQDKQRFSCSRQRNEEVVTQPRSGVRSEGWPGGSS